MKKILALLPVALFFLVPAAFADSHAAAAVNSYGQLAAYLGAAFAIGIGAFGGALGQGKAAAAALEGIGRNPGAADKMFVPMIIGLALIESLVIYALLIAFTLSGKF